MTLFSQTAEVQANFLGSLQKLKDLRIDLDVQQISALGDMTVTPGFTMLLVQGLAESNKSGIVALELAPANDNANKLLVNLIELLSPPTDSTVDKDENHGYDDPQNHPTYNWMEYSCGIAKSDRFHKFDGSYIVTIPAGCENIPDFLCRVDGLSLNESRPQLFLLLFI